MARTQIGQVLAGAALLVLFGCSEDKTELEMLRASVDASAVAVKACNLDMHYVPAEHSGNCVAYVRHFREEFAYKVCGESKGLHCQKLNRQTEFSYSLYWRAVANSLWTYGKPKGVDPDEVSSISGVYRSYFDLKFMERAFEECLAEEAAARRGARVNLMSGTESGIKVPVTSIRVLLSPGQKCIREGYTEPFAEGRT